MAYSSNAALDLTKERNFVGQTSEQRSDLENVLKSGYSVSDWENEGAFGYEIKNEGTGKLYHFSPNSRLTLETRYLEKNKEGEVTENVVDLFARVAVNVAEADLKYTPKKKIKPVARDFLESMLNQDFMPNTPTLCNAGRSLQQLSACFVLPVEDYMATDDIGEDPEKQGNGIYDALRYMAMVHKSGGGTGFNFSHLRPRGNLISTTFGKSSGPVSFIKSFDGATDAVNQGGFRRGANMAILNYVHPDIFEFVGEKANNGTLENFNLSIGVDNDFMEKVKSNGYFKMINSKDEFSIPEEERFWTTEDVLRIGSDRYKKFAQELNPSIVISEDGKDVINTYNNSIVGKVDESGELMMSAKALFDYVVDCAWREGCPGIINLERLESGNKIKNAGKIESTNPCGEQPLLPYEACNLGAINLSNCVEDGKLNWGTLEKRIGNAVHFLDNVIDMSKFPFAKVYEKVHGTRKIGMGLMGWAETLVELDLEYNSEEALDLARKVSDFMTQTGRKKSENIAKRRGTFPKWEGSQYEEEGIKLRNGTITTIAPNGTTGMIGDRTGGIEPFFKLAYKKTCMDGKELTYWAPGLKEKLKESVDADKLENILTEIIKTGSVQDIKGVPDKIKKVYLTSGDISPEDHIKEQAAWQVGYEDGVDNAVSKTVNLSESATREDIANAYMNAYELGCVGTTVFRNNSKKGVYSSLEEKAESGFLLVKKDVDAHPVLDIKPRAVKYKVKRPQAGDSLHMIVTSDLYVNDETKEAYTIPSEIFQIRAPLGEYISVSFGQSGIDRTGRLKSDKIDWSDMISQLQSPTSSEVEGIGPMKIKSIEHAAGLVLEHHCLEAGIVGRDDVTKRLKDLVKKSDLRYINPKKDVEEYEELMKQVKARSSGELEVVSGNNGKLGHKFICEHCGGEEYTFEAGCNHPKCNGCGEIEGGGCG